jgi:hypothetical protein
MFHSQRGRTFAQLEKRHKTGGRKASFLVPVFVELLQVVDLIQFHQALYAPRAYIPAPAERRNKCR